MKEYVFTNVRELRERAGISRQLVAERLFVVQGPWRREERLAAREKRFGDYEDGRTRVRSVAPIDLFALAVALGCGASDIKVSIVPP